MSNENHRWLERDEPTRISTEDIKFKQKVSSKELREIEWAGAKCLAKELANAKGFNSAGNVTVCATNYGEAKELEDGSKEQLIGCSGCGAMCTIIKSARAVHATPGTEDNPNIVVSVAEAPQPNPWDELGTFDDCKAGDVTVPTEASNLTEPVGLDYDQRAMFQLLRGHID